MPDKRSLGGRRHQCRACLNARKRAYLTPEKNYANIKKYRMRHPLKRKQYELKRLYNITLDQYHEMLAAHDGGCWICATKHPDTSNGSVHLFVDHCHKTGLVRGLLCMHCNRGVGHFKDDPELLHRAAYYLSPKPS